VPAPARMLFRCALLALAAGLAACDSGDAKVALQPSDLQPTRLSAADRQGYAAECRNTWKSAPQNRGMPVPRDEKTERDLGLLCDCFVDRLEERTSKLEFMIAMQVIRSLSAPFGDPPSFKVLAAGAARIGISEARFQETVAEARKTGGAAISYCTQKITSSR
jgi:hypothetical protein